MSMWCLYDVLQLSPGLSEQTIFGCSGMSAHNISCPLSGVANYRERWLFQLGLGPLLTVLRAHSVPDRGGERKNFRQQRRVALGHSARDPLAGQRSRYKSPWNLLSFNSVVFVLDLFAYVARAVFTHWIYWNLRSAFETCVGFNFGDTRSRRNYKKKYKTKQNKKPTRK